MYATIFVLAFVVCVVQSKPLDIPIDSIEDNPVHELTKRFIIINPSLSIGAFSNNELTKIRSKRSPEEECQKLRLCRLHARSNTNFFAAFELYFVNKENAHLWDHRARSLAECNERYSCYR
ncbi:unnamed protein product, partial [Brenthis ino]